MKDRDLWIDSLLAAAEAEINSESPDEESAIVLWRAAVRRFRASFVSKSNNAVLSQARVVDAERCHH